MAMLKLRPFGSLVARYTTQSSSAHPASGSPTTKPETVAAMDGDPTKYNVPEYYKYNKYSYYDIEIPVKKHRLPPPNTLDPLQPKK